jgi:putative phage-type endonuclease
MSANPTFHEDRAKGIGSSDVAAILGLNKWRSPFDVFLEKSGQAPPFQGNERTKWGKLLEATIIREYVDSQLPTGTAVEFSFDKSYVHPERSWQRASPDAVCRPRSLIIEAKNVGVRQQVRWGPGDDEVPDEYHLQGLWQASTLDLDHVGYAVLFGGNQFRAFKVERDRELEAEVVGRAGEWWERHVVKGEPPEVTTATEATARYVKEMLVKDSGLVREATREEIAQARELEAARAVKKAADERAETAGLKMRLLMGEATKIEGPGFSISWKLNKGRKEYTVAASPPSRVFRPTFEGGEDE